MKPIQRQYHLEYEQDNKTHTTILWAYGTADAIDTFKTIYPTAELTQVKPK